MEKRALSDQTGMLDHYADFHSEHIPARNVDVWLPPGYEADPQQHYPVIYMHDGQNLFDPALSYGGVDWGMDEAITRLVEQGLCRPAIVVGVWNLGMQRWKEYMPERPFSYPPPGDRPAWLSMVRERVQWFKTNHGGLPYSDRYLCFLVNELKPFIDGAYRSLPGRDDTLVMGSSMGGLISLYALFEYPQVFGRAGCFSTHWPAGPELLLPYVELHVPPPGSHRLYFDFGTKTLDATYEPYQLQADSIFHEAGYTPGYDILTLKFPGHEHSEWAWRGRVEGALRFLLGEQRLANSEQD